MREEFLIGVFVFQIKNSVVPRHNAVFSDYNVSVSIGFFGESDNKINE